MTSDLRVALAETVDALRLEASGAQREALLQYLAMLQRWNAVYNLTAVRDPEAMLVQHLADCLAVLSPLRRTAPEARRILDVGSGGGLPGVVLAIMLPAAMVTSVDAVGKKAAFVQQVAAELRLANLQAVHSRIERYDAEPFDLVTSRAFASLTDFVALTARLRADAGVWMAMKGKMPSAEIASLDSSVDVFHVEHLDVPKLDAERCLVWLKPQLPSL